METEQQVTENQSQKLDQNQESNIQNNINNQENLNTNIKQEKQNNANKQNTQDITNNQKDNNSKIDQEIQQQQYQNQNESQQKKVQEEEVEDPDKNDLKLCFVHKRPIEVICIDPICTKETKKCCLKCLTVTSEHSQHKSMDLDEACENYNEAINEIKNQTIVEEKYDVEKEIADIQNLIAQKQEQFQKTLQEINKKLITEILEKLNTRRGVIEQREVQEKQKQQGEQQSKAKTIQQEQIEQFKDKQLMEIDNPIQFQIAINVTKQFMKEKKQKQKQQNQKIKKEGETIKTQNNNDKNNNVDSQQEISQEKEKQQNEENKENKEQIENKEIKEEENQKIVFKNIIPEDTLQELKNFTQKYEDIEKLFFSDLEILKQDLFKKLNDRIIFKQILVQNQEVAHKQVSENIRLQKLRVFSKEKTNSQQFVSFGSGIKIWDIVQNQESKQEEAVILKSIEMKEFITSMLQFDENTIFLGSFTGSIFKIQDQEAKARLQVDNDEKPISGMKKVTSKQFLVSSISEKNTILLINTDCQVERIYKTYSDLILYTSMLQLKNRDYFVTASQKSKQIKLWNYKDQHKINYIKTHYSSSGLVYLKGNKFLLQECKQLVMYIVKDYRYIEQVKVFRDVHQNWIRDVVYIDKYNQLITASQDKTIKVWVYDDDKLSLTYQSKWIYSEIIKNIIFIEGKVISTSNDCCLQIWK